MSDNAQPTVHKNSSSGSDSSRRRRDQSRRTHGQGRPNGSNGGNSLPADAIKAAGDVEHWLAEVASSEDLDYAYIEVVDKNAFGQLKGALKRRIGAEPYNSLRIEIVEIDNERYPFEGRFYLEAA
jgi:hypothetical protein